MKISLLRKKLLNINQLLYQSLILQLPLLQMSLQKRSQVYLLEQMTMMMKKKTILSSRQQSHYQPSYQSHQSYWKQNQLQFNLLLSNLRLLFQNQKNPQGVLISKIPLTHCSRKVTLLCQECNANPLFNRRFQQWKKMRKKRRSNSTFIITKKKVNYLIIRKRQS